MGDVVIVSAVRTPIGSFMGSLSNIKASTLGASVINECIKRTKIDPQLIDEVIMGNIVSTDPRGNPAREALLEAGLPIKIPAFTINKNCASSLKAITIAASLIKASESRLIIAGGMESMSRIPHVIRDLRKGIKMGNTNAEDLMLLLLEGMGETAEKLADMYEITRAEQDSFALRSQINAALALSNGCFDDEILELKVDKNRGYETIFKEDEGVRGDSNIEALSKLKPVFRKSGTVTAGNSSTINDAASAVMLMDSEYAKELGIKPMAKLLGWSQVGVEPSIMGIGPVASTLDLLEKTGLEINDFDLIELNEAFAAQSIAVIKELGLDLEKVNVNGGAISLGHPTGATGAILVTKIVHALNKQNKKFGLVTLCIGGGQGMSLAIEALK